MAAQFGMFGRGVAAAAVLSLAMGGMVAVAQESGAPAATQQDQGGRQHTGEAHGRGGPERQVEMLTKRLDLTPDQVTQVKAIEEDAKTQAQGLRSDTAISQGDRHAKMRSIHEAAMVKVRAVLNDEQRAKLDAMVAQHREHRRHGEGSAPQPPPA